MRAIGLVVLGFTFAFTCPAATAARGRGGATCALSIGGLAQQAYLKASNTGIDDEFGWATAIWGDTLIVGAPKEDSGATVVDGDQVDDSVPGAGAAYVFVREGTSWTQQAYLKAAEAGFFLFGWSVAISGDTAVVGAPWGGTASVFVRSGAAWSLQATLVSSARSDAFGYSVAIWGDTILVGAPSDGSAASGVGGSPGSGLPDSGAAYVFVRVGGEWEQQAYLKASNPGHSDEFGYSVSLARNVAVVGAPLEDSASTGVNGDQDNDDASSAGAAYVFARSGSTWSQQAYLKASNADFADWFGQAVSIDDKTLVVGAHREDSSSTGVNGSQINEGAPDSGAAYVFAWNGTAWFQQAYLKASNTGDVDQFGVTVSIHGDRIVVGAPAEDSGATGVNGGQDDESTPGSGAAYLFDRSGVSWSPSAYLKASTPANYMGFGASVAVSGSTVLTSAPFEHSGATGVDGDESDVSAPYSGAAYVFDAAPAVEAYCTGKPNSQGCTPAMDWSGTPSASSASPFLLTCADVLNQKSGLLFYGFASAALPFQGATLCVLPPVKRTDLQNSLGNALPPEDCSGAFAFDMNAEIQSGADALLVRGAAVFAQYWARDPAASFGTSLSNAVLFEIAPLTSLGPAQCPRRSREQPSSAPV